MTTAKTCGPRYFEARTALGHDGDIQAFAAGFVTGLTEKVYLGACLGAMVRPEPENYDWLLTKVRIVAIVYGLTVREYRYPEDGPRPGTREVWILRNQFADIDFETMTAQAVNAPLWHHYRARLCGVPNVETDLEFHHGRPQRDARQRRRGQTLRLRSMSATTL